MFDPLTPPPPPIWGSRPLTPKPARCIAPKQSQMAYRFQKTNCAHCDGLSCGTTPRLPSAQIVGRSPSEFFIAIGSVAVYTHTCIQNSELSINLHNSLAPADIVDVFKTQCITYNFAVNCSILWSQQDKQVATLTVGGFDPLVELLSCRLFNGILMSPVIYTERLYLFRRTQKSPICDHVASRSVNAN